MIRWFWVAFNLIGLILSTIFSFFVKDPGFNGFFLIYFSFAIYLIFLVLSVINLISWIRGGRF